MRTDAGAELTLPRPWLERDRLRHAYALTGHKGQGMTILDAHVFGVSEGKLQEWGYVVMSRHQLDVQLYVVAPEWNEELDRPPRQLAYDPLAELTRSLGQSAAKTLATDRRDGDELAMRRALKTLAPGDLVRAIDTATELLVARPPERTGELRALAETRAVVAAACQNAAAIGEGRTTPIDLERLNGRLADLDARREQLEREQEACVRWDQDHGAQPGEPSSPARNSWPAMPPTWQRLSATHRPTWSPTSASGRPTWSPRTPGGTASRRSSGSGRPRDRSRRSRGGSRGQSRAPRGVRAGRQPGRPHPGITCTAPRIERADGMALDL